MKRAEIVSHASACAVIAAMLVVAAADVHQIAAWAKRPRAQISNPDATADPVPLPVRRPVEPTEAVAPPATTTPSATTLAPAENVAAPPTAPVPPLDWPDSEKIEALRQCVARLAALKARVSEPRSVRQDRCGGPALVELEAFDIDGQEVTFQPALLVNCEIVMRLHGWVAGDLQPMARELLGAPVARIEGTGGYQCRGVVGTPSKRSLSEHAFANAVDMSAFVTTDGRRVSVRDDWGEVARDLKAREASLRVAANAAPSRDAEDDAGPPPLPVRNPQFVDDTRRRGKRGRKGRIVSTAPPLTADLKPAESKPAEAKLAPAMDSEPATRTFLKRLHEAGCRRFSTALGPEANEAHRDHLHFDLAQRRSGRSYCE